MRIAVIRLVVYLLLAYLAYLAIRFVLSPPRRERAPRPGRRLQGVMVKDEVCNTYLPREDALRVEADGREYYFCSAVCRDKFLEQKKADRSRPS